MSRIILPPRKLYTPRPYQGMIVQHQLRLPRCCTWAGMGSGKTVATYTAIDIRFIAGNDKPVLVIAPKRVATTTWPEEARKWSHLKQITVMPIMGSEDERRRALKYDASVYTINFENLVWLVEYYGSKWPFEHVVIDESTRLKSFRLKQGGARARALGSIAHTKIKQIDLLTGTPSPNGLLDLWGQLWFVDQGARLGHSYEAFKQRWFRPPEYGEGPLVPMPHAQAEIQERLKDVCLTIDMKDWFDLEEPIVNNIYVDIPPKARKLYREMEKKMFIQLGERQVEAVNAASKTQKLLQLASGAVYLDPDVDDDYHPKSKDWKEVHDIKLQALEEIIEESGGEPILVAYHFRSDLARLLKAFPAGRVFDDSPKTQADWNACKIPLLFLHPKSAGHGLNLQHGGRTLVYFTHDWNLENRLQILERIGPVRQEQEGFKRSVFVHNIIARGTIDEDVIARTDGKKSVMEVLLEAMKRRQE
jgi:SNF2 family DNA or RNA helicase